MSEGIERAHTRREASPLDNVYRARSVDRDARDSGKNPFKDQMNDQKKRLARGDGTLGDKEGTVDEGIDQRREIHDELFLSGQAEKTAGASAHDVKELESLNPDRGSNDTPDDDSETHINLQA